MGATGPFVPGRLLNMRRTELFLVINKAKLKTLLREHMGFLNYMFEPYPNSQILPRVKDTQCYLSDLLHLNLIFSVPDSVNCPLRL